MKKVRSVQIEGGRFELDDIEFVIDLSARNRRPSIDQSFTLVKNAFYISIYENLAQTFQPSSVLELGVFQGGSFVLIDKLFQPLRMSAIDIAREPVEPLLTYVRKTPNRQVHFGISQTDDVTLNRIVMEELANELDFVIDDASHTYEHTRRSFEILFPLLRPGGLYLIEDWAWGHAPVYQGEKAPFAGRPALTNLLFEQIVLLGSSSMIAEILVRKPLYIIRKAANAKPNYDENMWDILLTRNRPLPKI